ncbi:hypothetical protein [Litorihabitans aurantiacus]|uniref:Uncharacterized protein n=1 Tax=Litorihabitans aurantiacus TaxID=1930061 RepID=A0AA37UR87_9MICO|nr:hypothetical protein [Litorihabitans aurantiacus]GMA31073.1 hypothetical protein GCM10025875_10650 [Litorihabitans aurantiacus]
MTTTHPRPGHGQRSAVRRLLRTLGAPGAEAYRDSMQRRERYAVGLLSSYVAHRSGHER